MVAFYAITRLSRFSNAKYGIIGIDGVSLRNGRLNSLSGQVCARRIKFSEKELAVLRETPLDRRSLPVFL